MTDVKPTTTDAGALVESDEHSLTVGPDGPVLLQDHYLIEQMANFNRERIPEWQPHAKGGGAFGHFEVTNDVSAYTKAGVFQPGIRTDTLSASERNETPDPVRSNAMEARFQCVRQASGSGRRGAVSEAGLRRRP